MDNAMQQLLNPKGKPLTKDQEQVVETFSQVDQEMKRLDRLAHTLGALNPKQTRKKH
jgi:enoyl-[acyl-carrier-protein] reductase (NADH)